MARPLRINVEDGVYHVMARGQRRRDIVRDDTDRYRWVSLLGEVTTRRRWRVLAWVLMDNHYHILAKSSTSNRRAEGAEDFAVFWLSGYLVLWFLVMSGAVLCVQNLTHL